jgi:flagellar biosynthesis protein
MPLPRRIRKDVRPAAQKERRRAVALDYDAEKDEAPRVVATGQGRMAEQIIALAQANDVPIREDPVLVAALSTLELDSVIPPQLYAVVAEVLAYVYRVRDRRQQALTREEDSPGR